MPLPRMSSTASRYPTCARAWKSICTRSLMASFSRVTPMSPSAISAPFDVEKSREDFPVLKQTIHGQPLVYLDSAATAQKPTAVVDAIRKFHEVDCANIHRGVHELSQRSTAAYEETRAKLRTFLHAKSSDELIFVRGTTEGINLVTSTWGRVNVKAADEII